MFVNNVLTHSKTEGGDGFVDTDAKLNVIVAAIRAQRDGSNGGLQSYGAVVPEGEEGGEDDFLPDDDDFVRPRARARSAPCRVRARPPTGRRS